MLATRRQQHTGSASHGKRVGRLCCVLQVVRRSRGRHSQRILAIPPSGKFLRLTNPALVWVMMSVED